MPDFPNVPNLPGVPQVARLLGAVNAPVNTILEAANTVLGLLTSAPVWGIYDQNNNKVVSPDSFADFSNRNEWNVVSFPVQAGSFASYNKVVVPFEISLRMRKGGTLSERTDFINQIAAIAADTNLYTVVTPEIAYENVNVTRYEVTRRGAGGAYYLAEVDIFLVQILQVTPQYTNTSLATQNAQDPSALPAGNQGNLPPNGVSVALGPEAVSQFNAGIGQ